MFRLLGLRRGGGAGGVDKLTVVAIGMGEGFQAPRRVSVRMLIGWAWSW